MTKLEKATHVALLSLAVIAGALMLEQRFRLPRSATTRADLEQSLHGTVLHIPDADWEHKEATIALQISSTCPYCVANEPFYKKLVKARDALGPSGKKVGILVLTGDDRESLRVRLQNGASWWTRSSILTDEATGTGATPVVFYVKPTGIVERAFVGQLDESRQAQVSELLKL